MVSRGGHRRVLGLALVLGVLAQVVPGCGARTRLPGVIGASCVAGETAACVGEDGCVGEQQCEHEGGIWSACRCEPRSNETCFEGNFRASTAPVSVHFVVDRSASMEVFWEPVREALRSFFSDSASGDLDVALTFFPTRRADDECAKEAYLVPDVAYDRLDAAPGDAHELSLLAQVDATFPGGGTPMFAAYAGAVEAAVARASKFGAQEGIVVLVTDGEPYGCNYANRSYYIHELAASSAAGSPRVRTFSLGLEGADEYLVENIAKVGLGEAFFISDYDVTREMSRSFDEIRHQIRCDYELSGSTSIQPEDISVTLALGGGAAEPLAHDPDCVGSGWTLEAASASQRLSLCAAACETVRNDERAELHITARCAAVGSTNTGGDAGANSDAVNENLGARCEGDADCGGRGLLCLKANSGSLDGGGPALGLCTAPCTENADCRALDDASRCELLGGERYCVERCEPGPYDLREFSPAKCHGRPEMGCSLHGESTIVAVCLPQCGSDEQCGAGLFCHARDGLCRTNPPSGLALGSRCDPAADACQGTCLPYGETSLAGVCSEWCVDGAPSCDSDKVPPLDSACLLELGAIVERGGTGKGDLGACLQLCDSDSDCGDESVSCIPIEFEPIAWATRRLGACGVAFPRPSLGPGSGAPPAR